MSRKPNNRSTEKVLEEKNMNARISYERKCMTPSFVNQQKKTKSKNKQKSLDRKKICQPIKNVKHTDNYISQGPLSHQNRKQSPFKHKNRPVSNLANVRHAKNIEHQLSNLNQSIFHEGLGIDDSNKKHRYDSVTLKVINQGKKCMKNSEFDKGIQLFSECLRKEACNLQAKYLLGVCAFHLQAYEDVIKHFSQILSKDDQYKKNIYLFLAIAYKKVLMIEESLVTLTKALSFFPKYYDALILRAKLLSKLKRYYDSIEDLNKCIKIDPKNIQAYVQKADCLRALSQHKDAVQIYSEVLHYQYDPQILLKRGIAYIQNGNIEEALQDLNRIIAKSPKNSQAYLFKGMAFTKAKNFNEAILSYEQAIKFNSSKKATTKALYEVSKLKIEMGDFYGASYTLERAGSLEVDLKVIEKLKIFTQGATFIMKKKFKKGIQNLNILAKKEHLNEQIKPLLYSFRSYGHFCQYKFANALSDLNNMMKNGYKLDSASQYNLELLEGIIQSQNNNFKEAISRFNVALNLRKDFSDPLIYQCLTKIGEYNRNAKTKNKDLLSQSYKFISKSLQKQENYNSYYIAAAILYTLGDMEDALDYIQKAIKASEDHVIKHFYLRALIAAMMENYKEAFNDFNIVLSLAKELKEKSDEKTDPDEPEKEKQILGTYLNRAKCYLLFGEKKKAFQDLQTYISYKPLDSQIHTVAGRLLFSIGACEDAVKAYNYSPNIDKKKQQLLERAKCYLLLKELNFCLKDMEKILELGDHLMRYDFYCLSALKEASKGASEHFKEALKKISQAQLLSIQNGHIFNQSDLLFYKGVFQFYLGQYLQASKNFIKSKNLKTLNNDLQSLDQPDPQGYSLEMFQNRIYSDVQIEYDIALCELMLDNLDNCKKVLKNYESFGLIFNEKNQLSKVEEVVDITPFPVSNRLCSIFGEIEYSPLIRFKLSFCLPTVSPPEIAFQIEEKIIQELSMSSTEPRPDAPWIKRNTFGVIFTDEVIGGDIDIKTEKSLKKLDQIRIEADEEDHSFEKDKARMKNMLAIDADLASKLEKHIKKKKQ